MRTLRTYLLAFLIGGVGYYTIEYLWRTLGRRGEVHHSMFFLGGLSLMLILLIDRRTSLPIVAKAFLAGAGITLMEFLLGAYAVFVLGHYIWEYGTADVHGIISWTWALLWCFFSLLVLLLLRYFRDRRAGRI